MIVELTISIDSLAAPQRRQDAQVRQAPRRRCEQAARSRVARFARAAHARGVSGRRVADALGLHPRTLTDWRQRLEDEPITCRTLGRPCQQASPEERKQVLDLMNSFGPRIGLPTLQRLYPTISRAELSELRRDYWWRYRQAHPHNIAELTWHQPGRVWAMDHAEPPAAIDGVYPAIFAVRDLSSGMQLAWWPTKDMTADSTIAVLKSLFIEHGAPLVLKSDNGSAFQSHALSDLLTVQGVTHLPSPPAHPEYNGSCEAGIGAMKVRTHDEAALRGRAGLWHCEDLEAARRHANEFHHPRGHHAPTAHELWQERAPISDTERSAFLATIQQLRQHSSIEQTLDAPTDHEHRDIVQQALIQTGLLTITRRSIPLQLNQLKMANIT